MFACLYMFLLSFSYLVTKLIFIILLISLFGCGRRALPCMCAIKQIFHNTLLYRNFTANDLLPDTKVGIHMKQSGTMSLCPSTSCTTKLVFWKDFVSFIFWRHSDTVRDAIIQDYINIVVLLQFGHNIMVKSNDPFYFQNTQAFEFKESA